MTSEEAFFEELEGEVLCCAIYYCFHLDLI